MKKKKRKKGIQINISHMNIQVDFGELTQT